MHIYVSEPRPNYSLPNRPTCQTARPRMCLVRGGREIEESLTRRGCTRVGRLPRPILLQMTGFDRRFKGGHTTHPFR
jgi:hypothetical protein